MAEWLFEAGIGEDRAVLVDRGRIVEARIEVAGSLRAGTVAEARLLRAADATGRARAMLSSGGEVELVAPPRGLPEGGRLLVEIVRERMAERGRIKPPRARPGEAGASPGDGPDLPARLAMSGHAVRVSGSDDDVLERHGWSEVMEAAATGIVTLPHLSLHISLTPAMTLIDVDGGGPAAALAVAGARASGEAIRLFDLAGSIGIDLPTMADKGERQAAAAALDAVLPQPFERTAVNGFGFLQIVRRRTRMSLPELIAADPIAAAARALLRRGERAAGHGGVTLSASAAVIDRIAARPDWTEALSRRLGAPVRLQPRGDSPISAGHAQRDHA